MKRVECWQSDSGTLFRTQEEALHEDSLDGFVDWYNNNPKEALFVTYDGIISAYDLREWLVAHANLIHDWTGTWKCSHEK